MDLCSSMVLAYPGKVTLAWNTKYFGQSESGMWMRCSRRRLGTQTAHRRWCPAKLCQQNQAGKPCGSAEGSDLQAIPHPWVIHAQRCVSLHSLICAFLTQPIPMLGKRRQGIPFWVSQHVTRATKALKASGLCPALSSSEGGEPTNTHWCRAQHSRNLQSKTPKTQ